MAVNTTKEPISMGFLERCCICRTPTAYWYKPKDVALCPDCALKVQPDQIPMKKDWIAKERAIRKKECFV